MKNQLYVFVLFLLFASCEKEQSTQTSVRGVVKERNGNRILAGAKVYLVKFTYGTFTNRRVKLDSTISNNQGQYNFTFDYGEGDFRVEAEYPRYFNLIIESDFSKQGFLDLGKSQVSNVELWPIAILKVRFIDLAGDNLGVDINGIFGGGGWQIREPDAIILAGVRGNLEEDIYYFPQPEGVPHQKTVHPSGNDTLYVEIQY
jgi:hypothetical protein